MKAIPTHKKETVKQKKNIKTNKKKKNGKNEIER